jgi:hypothetical protein
VDEDEMELDIWSLNGDDDAIGVTEGTEENEVPSHGQVATKEDQSQIAKVRGIG